MTIGISPSNSTVMAGLGTASFTVVTPGPYTCAFVSTIPPSSSLQVVVNLNGSPLLTVSGPSVSQPQMGGSVHMACVATDVITVVLSSAAAVDNTLNSIKTTINLYQGE